MAYAFDRPKRHSRAAAAGISTLALAFWVVVARPAVGTTGLGVTALLAVSANVSANCTISASAVSFGRYESLQANAIAPLNAAGRVSIACTKGSAPKITLDLGQNPSGERRHMALSTGGGAADRLTYELYLPPDTVSGTGCRFPGAVPWGSSPGEAFTPTPPLTRAPRSYSVCGTIPAGQGVSMGSYADTVVATVNF
jgi:spore coat protein U-like protein